MQIARHQRFFVALAVGGGTLFLPLAMPLATRLLLAGDSFFMIYLILTAPVLLPQTAEDLRRSATAEDEGLPVILFLTVAAITLSLVAILLLIDQRGSPEPYGVWLAVASVPLGWLTLHTVTAFHYARFYYAPDARGVAAGGLRFPGDEPPDATDFLYFALVIGMTAQVSDVEVVSRRMRRAVLLHGVASFFYNTVIVALAVNAVLALAG